MPISSKLPVDIPLCWDSGGELLWTCMSFPEFKGRRAIIKVCEYDNIHFIIHVLFLSMYSLYLIESLVKENGPSSSAIQFCHVQRSNS